MAFVTPTDPEAAKVEATDLRRQATALNNQADQLDPPKVEKKKPEVEKTEDVEGTTSEFKTAPVFKRGKK